MPPPPWGCISRLQKDENGNTIVDPRGSSRRDYFQKKTEKLHDQLRAAEPELGCIQVGEIQMTPQQEDRLAQFRAAAEKFLYSMPTQSSQSSNILAGRTIHVIGSVEPSLPVLRRLIGAAGGRHLYVTPQGADIIIAENLPPHKVTAFQRSKRVVVKPAWLVDSIRHGKLLPFDACDGFYIPDCYKQASPKGVVASFAREQPISPPTTPQVPIVEHYYKIGCREVGANLYVVAEDPDLEPLGESTAKQEKKEPIKTEIATPILTRGAELMARLQDLPPPYPAFCQSLANPSASLQDSSQPSSMLPIEDDVLPLTQLLCPNPDSSDYFPPSLQPDVSSFHPRIPLPPPSIPLPKPGSFNSSSGTSGMYQSASPSPPRPRVQQQEAVHTASDRGFLDEYKNNSRLRLLSESRMTARQYVARKLEDPLIRAKAPIPVQTPGKKIIIHVDLDCFFASVSISRRPHLTDQPVAVSHAQSASEGSTSDIASCNYIARKFGVQNGMNVGAAMKLCPRLTLVPYDFEEYRVSSQAFYDILLRYTRIIDPRSMDEALLDVTGLDPPSSLPPRREKKTAGPPSRLTSSEMLMRAMPIAESIRAAVRDELGITCSVGIGENPVTARLATKLAKPDGARYLTGDEVIRHFGSHSPGILPGVGPSLVQQLRERLNISTIADIMNYSVNDLAVIGPSTGERLYRAVRGQNDDSLTVPRVDKKGREISGDGGLSRQSTSVDVTWGVRFSCVEEAVAFVARLARELGSKLTDASYSAGRVTINVMTRGDGSSFAPHKYLGSGFVKGHTRTLTRSPPMCNGNDVVAVVVPAFAQMLHQQGLDPQEIRGFSLQATSLGYSMATASSHQRVLEFQSADDRLLLAQKQTVDAVDEKMEAAYSKDKLTEDELQSAQAYGFDVAMLRDIPPSLARQIIANGSLYASMFQPDGNVKPDHILLAPSNESMSSVALQREKEAAYAIRESDSLRILFRDVSVPPSGAAKRKSAITDSLMDAFTYLNSCVEKGAPPALLARLCRVLSGDRQLISDPLGTQLFSLLQYRFSH